MDFGKHRVTVGETLYPSNDCNPDSVLSAVGLTVGEGYEVVGFGVLPGSQKRPGVKIRNDKKNLKVYDIGWFFDD